MTEVAELEAHRYDRQIRVWGVEAQKRIQTSHIFISSLKGINCELAKNVVLAGINLVIQDDSKVLTSDLSSNFFYSSENVGAVAAEAILPHLQELNKFAKIDIETRSLEELEDNFFRDFDAVILSNCDEGAARRINTLIRTYDKVPAMFWSCSLYDEGWFMSDLGSFEYKPDPPNDKSTVTLNFPSFNLALSKRLADVPTKFCAQSRTFVKGRLLQYLRRSLQGQMTVGSRDCREAPARFLVEQGLAADYFTEQDLDRLNACLLLSEEKPTSVVVCSVLGSFLAQEVIKAVTRCGAPVYNVMVFSADDCVARAFPVV